MFFSRGQQSGERGGNRKLSSLTSRRMLFPGWIFVACVGLLLAGFLFLPWRNSQKAHADGCDQGTVLNIVAHEDDDLLFLSPDLLHDIQAHRCVRTIVVTTGDGGAGTSYWHNREAGSRAAYAEMSGVGDSWTLSDAGIAGHPIPLYTLSSEPTVSLIFMQLPDGNLDGSGFDADNNESLQKLLAGTIAEIHPLDGSNSYTSESLQSTLTSLITAFQPDIIRTQDYAGTYGDGDHSDHHAVGQLVQAAQQDYSTSHTLIGYQDYATYNLPANVSGTDLTAKQNAFFTYAPFDPAVCQSAEDCTDTGYERWLARQYRLGESSGNQAPVANAGPDKMVTIGTVVQLDGSGSTDANSDSLTYQWTQTSGPTVTLSNSTDVQPTFTAPDNPSTLTFQLIVNDGQVDSGPATVTIVVNDLPSINYSPLATATASSQNAVYGQTADKAIDGIIDGYPGDYTKEWATNGGGAGSWLKLTWSTSHTINKVILYDRPNLDDQVTGGTLQFSDGTSVNVDALDNAGAANVITFSSRTVTSVQFTITSVSGSTGNVGLAEMQVYGSNSGNATPIANAGSAQTVEVNTLVQLNGSGSSDSDGDSLTYQWTQTAGPTVTLSSTTAVQPTFTSPASETTLTFQLVVNDGHVNSSPATVTITVNSSSSTNIALTATATASSQNAAYGQTADKAIDGIIDGYPGDYTKEWATNGGGSGSWLKLTWSGSRIVTRIVLYDRPNTNDQITGGTLQFSDGSSITIDALNNDGSATTYSFSARVVTSVQLNITAVSGSTGNVGLAEMQVFGSVSSGGENSPPTANAGPDQTVGVSEVVHLDGSGSSDADGDPLAYQWTQTAGTTVTLSNSTAAQPTFTAPASTATLTFQLVVNDGHVDSSADTVTITVNNNPNLASTATVTCSSENTSTGQLAVNAIDGVIDGYPGDYTKEWATNGEGAGSWLKLTWSSAQTVGRIVLYDRPNANDQILGGIIQFSDGTTVTIGALNNDGSATVITFDARTVTSIQLNITAVSGSTGNVGLAEIQVYTY